MSRWVSTGGPLLPTRTGRLPSALRTAPHLPRLPPFPSPGASARRCLPAERLRGCGCKPPAKGALFPVHIALGRKMFSEALGAIKLIAGAPAAGPLPRLLPQARPFLFGRVPPTGPPKTARDRNGVAPPKPGKTHV